jgi:DNA-binding winged helix-turn-helix (wHTH) protein
VGSMSSNMVTFGEFELDMGRYQLRRGGFPVKLENLPLELLMLLVKRRGELVTRREIEDQLWGSDVFVDVDQGINTAVRKVRQVLRDRPERPRYLQTVVGKGYRFLAPEVLEGNLLEETPAFKEGAGSVTLPELGQAILCAAGLDRQSVRREPGSALQEGRTNFVLGPVDK